MTNIENRLRKLEQDSAADADFDGRVVWVGDGPPPASGPRHIQDIRWVSKAQRDDAEQDAAQQDGAQ